MSYIVCVNPCLKNLCALGVLCGKIKSGVNQCQSASKKGSEFWGRRRTNPFQTSQCQSVPKKSVSVSVYYSQSQEVQKKCSKHAQNLLIANRPIFQNFLQKPLISQLFSFFSSSFFPFALLFFPPSAGQNSCYRTSIWRLL
jgi:hypothetical protein